MVFVRTTTLVRSVCGARRPFRPGTGELDYDVTTAPDGKESQPYYAYVDNERANVNCAGHREANPRSNRDVGR
jgi:hypothetical protein